MGAPMFVMRYSTIQVEPLTGALGAEVHGVDLAQDLGAEVVADLHRALMDHLVIFFRDQIMTPEQQKALGRRFGELHIHPITEPMKGHPEIIEVIKEADELGNWGDEWHTDLTALPEPPLGSILYAKEVPPFSGDTQFSNMYLAYETLSSDLRRFLDGMVCHHRQKLAGYSGYKSMANKSSEPSEALHPLVRTHPVTGKKAFSRAPRCRLIKRALPGGERLAIRVALSARGKSRLRLSLSLEEELGGVFGTTAAPGIA